MGNYSGEVVYGARAFDQDADLAMRGDIVRAFIELITNSDDAYPDSKGKILVKIEKTGDPEYPVKVSVLDHAVGLDADGLRDCFAVLGGEKAKSKARGLLGRGAKDVAGFGYVEFAAIKDGSYSKLRLQSGQFIVDPVNKPATEADRKSLVLDKNQNGLTATIWIKKNHAIPSAANLQQSLSRHAQLRDLMSRRPVRIEDARSNGFKADIPTMPVVGEIVIDKQIKVAGYEVPVHLEVRRLPQRDKKNVSDYSDQGLLVQSGVSIFENTWFGMEGAPEANFFAGVVRAPQAADIIRAFDRDEDLGGNVRLLSRDRDGLVKNHPYSKALAMAVIQEVKPIFEELSKEMNAQKKQGDNLSKDFKVLSNVIRKEIEKAISEIDEDDLGGGQGSKFLDFCLIPPVRKAQTGEVLTFLARSVKQPTSDPRAIIEIQAPDGTLLAIDVPQDDWKHNEQLGVWDRRIHVTAGSIEGFGSILVEVDGESAKANITVNDSSSPDYDPIEAIRFDHSLASVSPMKKRHLTLLAPMSYVEQKAVLASNGYEFASIPQSVVLQPHSSGRYSMAKVTCVATSQEGEANVTAQIVGQSQQAACKVKITLTAGQSGLDFKCELRAHKHPSGRSQLEMDNGVMQIRVFPIHPSFNGLFGPYSEEKQMFENEDAVEARAILAEVIGDEISTYLTILRYEKYPEQLNDAPRVLIKASEYKMQFQKILHKVLGAMSQENDI